MKNWEHILISPSATLREALAVIDRGAIQIALVVDDERRLLGTLSDGDVRRALLRGAPLESATHLAMQASPTTAPVGSPRAVQLKLMQSRGIHQLPLTRDGVVMGLSTLDELVAQPIRATRVVIMAGGLGSRLRDLTKDTPKPMLKVGARPLLETLILSFAEQGFRRFSLAVNYKAEVIENHFGDGASFGVEVEYLREQQRLGTAGALSLLAAPPQEPFVVTNGDLLMKEDFGRMVDDHIAADACITVGARRYEMQVPFGVITEEAGRVSGIQEKPVHAYQVSAGIYVLSPRALKLVPSAAYFDMPSLLHAAIAEREHVRTHMIEGYWLDVGRLADYERANVDFDAVFS